METLQNFLGSTGVKWAGKAAFMGYGFMTFLGAVGGWHEQRSNRLSSLPILSGIAETANTDVSIAAVSPAAWYADPYSRYELRYWNGEEWTKHVARGGRQFADSGRLWANAAFYLGLLSFLIWPLGFVAVLAAFKARSGPRLEDTGARIGTGFVGGSIGVVGCLLLLSAYVIETVNGFTL